jgi:hypothetical protein
MAVRQNGCLPPLQLFLLATSWAELVHRCEGGSSKPHIILTVADDLGYNDVSMHGSKQVPTPNLDAMAKAGVMLMNYYVQPVCSPTRSASLDLFS